MDRDLLRDAIDHLEIAVRQSPTNPRYLAALGEAWLLHGDAAAALAPLERSVSYERHPRVTCLMALALLRLDRPQDAEHFANAAIDEAPFFHRAWFVRAQSRMNLGHRLAGAEDLREAMHLEPSQGIYGLRLAALLIDLAWEDRETAVHEPMLIEAHHLLSDDTAKNSVAGISQRMAEIWSYFQACIGIEVGDAKGAVTTLRALKWPHSQECAYRLALAFGVLGNLSAAREAYQRAAADPDLKIEVQLRMRAMEEAREGSPFVCSRVPRIDLLELHALGPTEVLGMRGGRLSYSEPGGYRQELHGTLSETPPSYQPSSDSSPKSSL